MKQGVLIGVVVAVQLFATIVTHLFIIKIVGVGEETDAYVLALAMPAVLVAIIATALQSVWLPRLAVLVEKSSAWDEAQSIAQGQAFLLGTGVILAVATLLPIWVQLIFPRLGDDQVQTVILFSLPLLLATIFNIQSAVLTVALQAGNRFLTAELIAMTGSLLSLVIILELLPDSGLELVVWLALLRAVGVYIAQLWLSGWPAISITKGWQCKEAWRMMRPLLFGTSIYKTSPLVDRYFSSSALSGGATIFNLAQMAMSALSRIMERAICVPLTPSFARYIAESDYGSLKKAYRRGILHISIGVALFAALLVLLKPVILLILVSALGLVAGTAEQVWTLAFLLLGFLHVAASGTLLVAVFYALGDSRTPMKIGLMGFLASIVLKAIGFYLLDLEGLAMAISAYYIGNFVVTNIILVKDIDARQSS